MDRIHGRHPGALPPPASRPNGGAPLGPDSPRKLAPATVPGSIAGVGLASVAVGTPAASRTLDVAPRRSDEEAMASAAHVARYSGTTGTGQASTRCGQADGRNAAEPTSSNQQKPSPCPHCAGVEPGLGPGHDGRAKVVRRLPWLRPGVRVGSKGAGTAATLLQAAGDRDRDLLAPVERVVVRPARAWRQPVPLFHREDR